MGFFDFIKGKTKQEEIDDILDKLQQLLQNEEVQTALMEVQIGIPVGITGIGYLEEVDDLICKLSELTGKTVEEIYNNLE